MNKTSYFFLIIVSILYFQHCSKEPEVLTPLSQVRFWTQEKLDRHKDRLLEIDQLEGDVYITDVFDLSAFQNLKSITGDLQLQYTDLENLEDLSKLEVVKNLKIDVNPNLTLLELKNLERVKENILILTNVALREIKLPKLEEVGTVAESGQLQNGGVGVMNNDELLTASVPSLKNHSEIIIQQNDKFSSLIGLNNPPENAFYWHTIRLDFDKMNCPPDLFKYLDENSEFRVKIKNIAESNFEWLSNTKTGTSLSFYGDFIPDDFCILKEIISDGPWYLRVFQYDQTINYSFTGIEVLENCQ